MSYKYIMQGSFVSRVIQLSVLSLKICVSQFSSSTKPMFAEKNKPENVVGD